MKGIDAGTALDRHSAANKGRHGVCLVRRFIGDVGHNGRQRAVQLEHVPLPFPFHLM
jgi:hypothetical protein